MTIKNTYCKILGKPFPVMNIYCTKSTNRIGSGRKFAQVPDPAPSVLTNP